MRATSVTSQPAAAPPPCPAMAKYGRQAAYAPAGSLVCKYYDRIFHPAKDLPPIKNTRPNENLVRTAPQHLPPRPAVSQRFRPADALSQSLPQPGNGDEGWLVNYQSTQWGPGAMEIAQPTLNIPSSIANLAPADTGVVIFAPTNKP